MSTTLVFSQRTDIGLQRQTNEDSSISVLPEDPQILASKGALFIVADGLGGHTRGAQASKLAVNTIRDAYYQQESASPLTALRLAIEQANKSLYEKNLAESSQMEHDKMMGTTCVAAVVRRDTLYIANVGDSRAYIIRGGQARQISLDHSVVARLVREGELTREQASDHPDRNKIYRCLGAHDAVEPDTFSERLQAGDSLLLCTDGLWELVADEDLAGIVQQHAPQESALRLIERANELGGRDNITTIVIQIAS
jgi:serine/threonine protein phosphatase PrpC